MAGICFDSGGYNIKTGANCGVELMKLDMGGAGAALGAASAIGALKPKGIEVCSLYFAEIQAVVVEVLHELGTWITLVISCHVCMNRLIGGSIMN